MSGKQKKDRNHDPITNKIIMITAILELIHIILEIIEDLLN